MSTFESVQVPDPTPETHPELVWAHRGAEVHYTTNDAKPDTLYAWITLHDGRKASVCERLLRVIQDPEAPHRGPLDPTAQRRSFLAAVVATIDHHLDHTAQSWLDDTTCDPPRDRELKRGRQMRQDAVDLLKDALRWRDSARDQGVTEKQAHFETLVWRLLCVLGVDDRTSRDIAVAPAEDILGRSDIWGQD